ncbi:ABC transporter [Cryptosporidium ubiquitum]|uniref:ABC transporter n=1 Tax=Cryptosporidium ubiquitum TaxID=857276 RepID=A0A1J4MDX1_9CRYT|nr:ABC transporter [Cryptosporidium ubiquitum]OII72424.1 ABC transporter [Cryptosporidium ubiquitum]
MGLRSYLTKIWNISAFGFINPYLLNSKNPRITSINDLPELFEVDKLDHWVEKLSLAIEDEEKKSMYRNERFRIHRPLIKTLWKPTLEAIFLRLCFDILALLSSIFLSYFSESSSITNTMISSLYIFLTVIFKSFFDCHSRIIVSRLCIRIEGSLIWVALDRVVRHKEMYPELPLSTTYMTESSKKPSSCRKSLLLRQNEVKFSNSNAASESSNIFNLIIGDAAAIELFFGVFVDFLLLPIRLLMSWYVLSKVLKSSSALPTLLSFCIMLGLSFLFEIIGAFNKEPFMINRDKRIDRCHEILSDMRFVRLTGLEDVAISRITKSREEELYWNKKRFIYSRIAAFIDYHLKVYSQYILFMLSTYYLFYYSNNNSKDNFLRNGASALQILMQLSSKIRSLPTNIIEGIISIQRYENFIITHPIERRRSSSDIIKPINNHSLLKMKYNYNNNIIERMNSNDDNNMTNNNFSELNDRICSNSSVSVSESALISASSIVSKYINISETTSLIGGDSYYNKEDELSYIPDRYNTKSNSNITNNKFPSNLMVLIEDGIFTWNSELHNDSFTNTTLRNINISLRLRECIFLVGEPGCGKSSLIKAVLNEIRPSASSIYVKPRETNSIISYSPQLPWIPSGSIRSAILLGREWNREKYELIIDCCQLKEDFSSWQLGDLRIVDEGGVSLSGGQRARISLARALYSLPIRFSTFSKNKFFIDAENPQKFESLLYLFDDVFVSVDPKVGFQIFNRLFGPNGLLLTVSSIVTISIDSLHHYMANIQYLYNNNSSNIFNDNATPDDNKDINDLDSNQSNINSSCKLKESRKSFISTNPNPLYNNSSVNSTSSYQDYNFNFDGFKFNVCVLNDGKVEWSGSYSDYLKETRHKLFDQELVGDNLVLNTSYFKSLELESLNLNDDSNNTDNQFTELLNSEGGNCKNKDNYINHRFSFSSYNWYFKLIGSKWMIVFIFGCVMKVIIDKILELLYVNKSDKIQITESYVYRFCFNATLAVLIESIISLIIYIGEAIGGIEAAKKSHEIFLYKIVYAPFWFFYVNSVGKILSRFSSDMLAIDNCTIRRITAVILPLISLLFNVSYVSFMVPITLPFEIILIIFTIKYIGDKLLLTYRDAQRCALLALSPLCSIFSECLSGGTIIRAFDAEKVYLNKCASFIEKLQRARFLQHCACQWAGLHMQLLTAPLTLIVSIIGIISPSYNLTLALPLTYTISFAESINEIIFRLISLEKDMCSVGRIYEYINLIDEDSKAHPQIILEDFAIPDTRQGILISDLEVRYRRPNYKLNDSKGKELVDSSTKTQSYSNDVFSNLDNMYFPPTLKNINEFAGPNDHIGIVGRSGSGKSTFIMALFGFVPTTKGYIYLDGVPINQMPSSTKRKIVGVLPQVPLILKGWTVRDFLDPEGQRSSEDLWEALRICCLSGTIRSLPGGKMLDTVLVPDIKITSSTVENSIHNKNNIIMNNKKNTNISCRDDCQESITSLVARYLSDSQLRYLSLARLVVNARDYRLILVDEPPPDTFEDQTSAKSYVPVHELLRTYFPHCTVFVVAHHAASLQNCNSIWVLGNGTIETVIHPKAVVSQKYLAGLLKNN